MWTTLGEIGSWQSGATPSRMNKDYYGGNIPWLKTGDLNDGTITYISEYITQRALEETSVRLNPKGSVLIAMYGATIGKIGILSFPATTNQACCACYEYSINQMFLFYFLLANRENFIAMGGGGAQPNISKEKIISTSMPLPPLKEQERIVAEIERWLSFVDIVEKEKSDLQSTICLAKSKILDLAIHGKLVPQDPNDEPASELLRRINPKAEITCDNPQYGKLPKGWCSCTLRNVCSFTNGFAFNSDAYKNNGIPLVRISNITNEGKIDLNSCVYIQDEIDEQYIIEKGDFLVAMSGATTGKMGVYTYGEISYLNQRVGKIKASKALYTPYMHYLMYSQVDNILKMAYGGAQPNISAKAILAIRILLPPLAEQQRIVAKIEDLFTQLDKIEASL